MLENLLNSKFEYKKLTESEQKTRGILGRLVGVIADTVSSTRNGRKYSSKLWENVFSNPIMKEKISNKVCFGELGHPADRTETDIEKVAICLAEQPKKGKDGKLYGVFDILNTPNGKILKALCDYGCNIGISSRGQGDIITDENGDESVDPDTYDCECFDAVLVPGVESARLKYVTESLNKENKLKLALYESLNSANENERNIMEETLNNLKINLTEATEESEETIMSEVESDDVNKEEEVSNDIEDLQTKDEDQDVIDQPDEEQIDNFADDVSLADEESIQNAELDDESEVESSVTDNDKDEKEVFLDFLSNNFDEDKVEKVCKILDIELENNEDIPEETVEKTEADVEDNDIKDAENIDSDVENDDELESTEDIDDSDEDENNETEEDIDEAIDDRSDVLVSSLKEAIKNKSDLENEVKSLQEKLAVSDAKVSDIEEECNRYKKAITRLSKLAKSNKDLKETASKLEESLAEKNEAIEAQKARIARLVKARKETLQNKNELNENVSSKETEIQSLNENLNSVKSDYTKLQEDLQKINQEKDAEINKLTESLDKQTSLKESYKKLANKTVNKYIDVKADILGLTARDIKRKLGESYTIEDIDEVCESLKSYNLNVSKLPFSIDKKVSVKVNESKSGIINKKSTSKLLDDDVDDTLMKLANYYN